MCEILTTGTANTPSFFLLVLYPAILASPVMTPQALPASLIPGWLFVLAVFLGAWLGFCAACGGCLCAWAGCFWPMVSDWTRSGLQADGDGWWNVGDECWWWFEVREVVLEVCCLLGVSRGRCCSMCVRMSADVLKDLGCGVPPPMFWPTPVCTSVKDGWFTLKFWAGPRKMVLGSRWYCPLSEVTWKVMFCVPVKKLLFMLLLPPKIVAESFCKLVAGTMDALFKKSARDISLLFMLDWKIKLTMKAVIRYSVINQLKWE